MNTDGTVTAVIHDLTHDGLGIAVLEGGRAFVAGALPDETVVLQARRRKRKYREADLIEVLEPSASRVGPHCKVFGRCGGCVLQHLEYQAQVAFKQKVVADAFSTIAKLNPAEWLPPITGTPWAYRRRARLGIKYVSKMERVLVGFRERAAPYVTDMDTCPVLATRIGSQLVALSEAISATGIKAKIPQAEVAIGDDCGAIILRVLEKPSARDEDVLRTFGEQTELDIYLQPAGPDSIYSLMSAPRQLSYRLRSYGIEIRFEPTDFIQINAEVNEMMVASAIEAGEFRTTDRVLDLYCGLGNFTLPMAQRAQEVLGVEGDAALVARGLRNAELNGITNARFVVANLDATEWSFFRENWDVVFLDPARTGALSAVASMGRMAPRRVVYVSCHPGTLARDAATLVHEQGYRLRSVRVLDMFPHTHHVEAIAVFDRAD
jgi:23S rRNA (uracil1939-C5)-methyltransferase